MSTAAIPMPGQVVPCRISPRHPEIRVAVVAVPLLAGHHYVVGRRRAPAAPGDLPYTLSDGEGNLLGEYPAAAAATAAAWGRLVDYERAGDGELGELIARIPDSAAGAYLIADLIDLLRRRLVDH